MTGIHEEVVEIPDGIIQIHHAEAKISERFSKLLQAEREIPQDENKKPSWIQLNPSSGTENPFKVL